MSNPPPSPSTIHLSPFPPLVHSLIQPPTLLPLPSSPSTHPSLLPRAIPHSPYPSVYPLLPSHSPPFRVRLLDIDYAVLPPVHHVDPTSRPLSCSPCPIPLIPLIRVYGSTPSGQSCCLHIHHVFPYFYVDVPTEWAESEKFIEMFATQLDNSTNEMESMRRRNINNKNNNNNMGGDGGHEDSADDINDEEMEMGRGGNDEEVEMEMNNHNNNNNNNNNNFHFRSRPRIYDITHHRGIPFYGYHSSPSSYLKISVLDPSDIRVMSGILRAGAMLSGIKFQPHHSHLPFLLQFLMDYNVFGMDFIEIEGKSVLFRQPMPRERRTIEMESVRRAMTLNGKIKQNDKGNENDKGSEIRLDFDEKTEEEKRLIQSIEIDIYELMKTPQKAKQKLFSTIHQQQQQHHDPSTTSSSSTPSTSSFSPLPLPPDPLWLSSTTPSYLLSSLTIPRHTFCDIEVDIHVDKILNIKKSAKMSMEKEFKESENSKEGKRLVQSLIQIWENERERRRNERRERRKEKQSSNSNEKISSSPSPSSSFPSSLSLSSSSSDSLDSMDFTPLSLPPTPPRVSIPLNDIEKEYLKQIQKLSEREMIRKGNIHDQDHQSEMNVRSESKGLDSMGEDYQALSSLFPVLSPGTQQSSSPSPSPQPPPSLLTPSRLNSHSNSQSHSSSLPSSSSLVDILSPLSDPSQSRSQSQQNPSLIHTQSKSKTPSSSSPSPSPSPSPFPLSQPFISYPSLFPSPTSSSTLSRILSEDGNSHQNSINLDSLYLLSQQMDQKTLSRRTPMTQSKTKGKLRRTPLSSLSHHDLLYGDGDGDADGQLDERKEKSVEDKEQEEEDQIMKDLFGAHEDDEICDIDGAHRDIHIDEEENDDDNDSHIDEKKMYQEDEEDVEEEEEQFHLSGIPVADVENDEQLLLSQRDIIHDDDGEEMNDGVNNENVRDIDHDDDVGQKDSSYIDKYENNQLNESESSTTSSSSSSHSALPSISPSPSPLLAAALPLPVSIASQSQSRPRLHMSYILSSKLSPLTSLPLYLVQLVHSDGTLAKTTWMESTKMKERQDIIEEFHRRKQKDEEEEKENENLKNQKEIEKEKGGNEKESVDYDETKLKRKSSFSLSPFEELTRAAASMTTFHSKMTMVTSSSASPMIPTSSSSLPLPSPSLISISPSLSQNHSNMIASRTNRRSGGSHEKINNPKENERKMDDKEIRKDNGKEESRGNILTADHINPSPLPSPVPLPLPPPLPPSKFSSSPPNISSPSLPIIVRPYKNFLTKRKLSNTLPNSKPANASESSSSSRPNTPLDDIVDDNDDFTHPVRTFHSIEEIEDEDDSEGEEKFPNKMIKHSHSDKNDDLKGFLEEKSKEIRSAPLQIKDTDTVNMMNIIHNYDNDHDKANSNDNGRTAIPETPSPEKKDSFSPPVSHPSHSQNHPIASSSSSSSSLPSPSPLSFFSPPSSTPSSSSSSSSSFPLSSLRFVPEHFTPPDMDEYMHQKRKKTREQWRTEAKNSAENSQNPMDSLFRGVCIWVDGHVTPSMAILRPLIYHHGGTVENVISPLVTHIVASHLPSTKIIEYKNHRHPRPVVTPQWIIKSIDQKRKLDTKHFIIDELRTADESQLTKTIKRMEQKGEEKKKQIEMETSRSSSSPRSCCCPHIVFVSTESDMLSPLSIAAFASSLTALGHAVSPNSDAFPSELSLAPSSPSSSGDSMWKLSFRIVSSPSSSPSPPPLANTQIVSFCLSHQQNISNLRFLSIGNEDFQWNKNQFIFSLNQISHDIVKSLTDQMNTLRLPSLFLYSSSSLQSLSSSHQSASNAHLSDDFLLKYFQKCSLIAPKFIKNCLLKHECHCGKSKNDNDKDKDKDTQRVSMSMSMSIPMSVDGENENGNEMVNKEKEEKLKEEIPSAKPPSSILSLHPLAHVSGLHEVSSSPSPSPLLLNSSSPPSPLPSPPSSISHPPRISPLLPSAPLPSSSPPPSLSPFNGHGVRSSATDPNFVSTYFTTSRLHFIGSWKRHFYRNENKLKSQNTKYPNPYPLPLPSPSSPPRVIIHIDMDCFFVSASIRHDPSLQNKPVVVCHSKGGKFSYSSSVSSASYEARQYGIHAETIIGKALEKCPHLTILPYEFDKYVLVSDELYKILFEFTSAVEAVSLDEAFIELPNNVDGMKIAEEIRHTVFSRTLCHCSCGVGSSPSSARMATKFAKPNKSFQFTENTFLSLTESNPISWINGIGWKNERKLTELKINTIGEFRAAIRSPSMLSHLQSILGQKSCDVIMKSVKGIDDRLLVFQRPSPQSIGAEVNWGVRCESVAKVHQLIRQVAEETIRRLHETGRKSQLITIKAKKRTASAPIEPSKFLGHGICDSFSKSVNLSSTGRRRETFIRGDEKSLSVLVTHVIKVYDAMRIDPSWLRGFGIQLGKLSVDEQEGNIEEILRGKESEREGSGNPNHFIGSDDGHTNENEIDVRMGRQEGNSTSANQAALAHDFWASRQGGISSDTLTSHDAQNNNPSTSSSSLSSSSSSFTLNNTALSEVVFDDENESFAHGDSSFVDERSDEEEDDEEEAKNNVGNNSINMNNYHNFIRPHKPQLSEKSPGQSSLSFSPSVPSSSPSPLPFVCPSSSLSPTRWDFSLPNDISFIDPSPSTLESPIRWCHIPSLASDDDDDDGPISVNGVLSVVLTPLPPPSSLLKSFHLFSLPQMSHQLPFYSNVNDHETHIKSSMATFAIANYNDSLTDTNQTFVSDTVGKGGNSIVINKINLNGGVGKVIGMANHIEWEAMKISIPLEMTEEVKNNFHKNINGDKEQNCYHQDQKSSSSFIPPISLDSVPSSLIHDHDVNRSISLLRHHSDFDSSSRSLLKYHLSLPSLSSLDKKYFSSHSSKSKSKLKIKLFPKKLRSQISTESKSRQRILQEMAASAPFILDLAVGGREGENGKEKEMEMESQEEWETRRERKSTSASSDHIETHSESDEDKDDENDCEDSESDSGSDISPPIDTFVPPSPKFDEPFFSSISHVSTSIDGPMALPPVLPSLQSHFTDEVTDNQISFENNQKSQTSRVRFSQFSPSQKKRKFPFFTPNSNSPKNSIPLVLSLSQNSRRDGQLSQTSPSLAPPSSQLISLSHPNSEISSSSNPSSSPSSAIPSTSIPSSSAVLSVSPSHLCPSLSPSNESLGSLGVSMRSPSNMSSHDLLTLSVEIHCLSRGSLLSDPAIDAVAAIVFAIRKETYGKMRKDDDNDIKGVIIWHSPGDFSLSPPIIYPIDSFTNNILCPSESLMMDSFVNVVRTCDPDIIIGYELQRTGLGYLFDRAKAIYNRDMGGELGRIRAKEKRREEKEKGKDHSPSAFPVDSNVRAAVQYSLNNGSNIRISGRVVLNLWRLMRDELKLTQYTFEFVSMHAMRKRFPHYTQMRRNHWWINRGGGPSRCIRYVMDRVIGNLDLLESLDIIGRTSELSRVFGIKFQNVLDRGSQFRVESMMVRVSSCFNFILPSLSPEQRSKQPAMEAMPLIMEPQSRFYSSPIIVLDFQSLYPSMMIAYNICYSTCLGKLPYRIPTEKESHGVVDHGDLPPKYPLGGYHMRRPKDLLHSLSSSSTDSSDVSSPPVYVTPNGVMFVNSSIRRGVLPLLLSEILSTRVMVKKTMGRPEVQKDRPLLRVLNSRQFALKLIANVTYGYTAAGYSGRMPCAEIADAIVSSGRDTLEKAIQIVEENSNWAAKVVYGDTDSLFISLEGRTKSEAFRIGREIASAVSSANPKPVKLHLDKVYYPSLLVSKKRYCGYKYENENQVTPTLECKGLEMVRRDGCPLLVKTQEKIIRILFETRDLSKVKRFLYQQFGQIYKGDFIDHPSSSLSPSPPLPCPLALEDFIIAKEVRLGTYKVPPVSALVSLQMMKTDSRAAPLYAERVPFIIADSHLQALVRDRAIHPLAFVDHPEMYRISAAHYVEKVLVPPIKRLLQLMGVDVEMWEKYWVKPKRKGFAKMHTGQEGENHNHHIVGMGMGSKSSLPLPSSDYFIVDSFGLSRPFAKSSRRTISQYYKSTHCVSCGDIVVRPSATHEFCSHCLGDKTLMETYLLTIHKIQREEMRMREMQNICGECQGTSCRIAADPSDSPPPSLLSSSSSSSSSSPSLSLSPIPSNSPLEILDCWSLDCPVFFRRCQHGSEIHEVRDQWEKFIKAIKQIKEKKKKPKITHFVL